MTTSGERLQDGDAQALHRMLGVAARRWRAEVQQRLRGAGLADLDARVLVELQDREPLKQQELADRLGVSNTAVMQAVDRLENAQLVERRAAPDDRRSNVVVPMASAAAVLAIVQAAVRTVGGDALAEVSAADLAATLRVLGAIVGRLET